MKKTDTKSAVLLRHHLKALKLPTMHAECEKIAQRCAADNADHLAYLLQLCELEPLIEDSRRPNSQRPRPSSPSTSPRNRPSTNPSSRS